MQQNGAFNIKKGEADIEEGFINPTALSLSKIYNRTALA